MSGDSFVRSLRTVDSMIVQMAACSSSCVSCAAGDFTLVCFAGWASAVWSSSLSELRTARRRRRRVFLVAAVAGSSRTSEAVPVDAGTASAAAGNARAGSAG